MIDVRSWIKDRAELFKHICYALEEMTHSLLLPLSRHNFHMRIRPTQPILRLSRGSSVSCSGSASDDDPLGNSRIWPFPLGRSGMALYCSTVQAECPAGPSGPIAFSTYLLVLSSVSSHSMDWPEEKSRPCPALSAKTRFYNHLPILEAPFHIQNVASAEIYSSPLPCVSTCLLNSNFQDTLGRTTQVVPHVDLVWLTTHHLEMKNCPLFPQASLFCALILTLVHNKRITPTVTLIQYLIPSTILILPGLENLHPSRIYPLIPNILSDYLRTPLTSLPSLPLHPSKNLQTQCCRGLDTPFFSFSECNSPSSMYVVDYFPSKLYLPPRVIPDHLFNILNNLALLLILLPLCYLLQASCEVVTILILLMLSNPLASSGSHITLCRPPHDIIISRWMMVLCLFFSTFNQIEENLNHCLLVSQDFLHDNYVFFLFKIYVGNSSSSYSSRNLFLFISLFLNQLRAFWTESFFEPCVVAIVFDSNSISTRKFTIGSPPTFSATLSANQVTSFEPPRPTQKFNTLHPHFNFLKKHFFHTYRLASVYPTRDLPCEIQIISIIFVDLRFPSPVQCWLI
ncbi:hypothetical protein VP01_7g12 [Puccinia sorghi]|uniref:Uncharacterized protein n=1 Tax=Puccinia sorghi TaxID=27349 RepID=A0A0L6UBD0_9BASI|nr:hypothetical protein VP01_7g12 [Puccinia sorghi]